MFLAFFSIVGCIAFLYYSQTKTVAQKQEQIEAYYDVKDLNRDGRVDFWEETATDATPERLYERCWALALLETVLHRLRAEAAAADRLDQFETLKVFLTGEKPAISYAELATRSATTEAALKMAVQRLRRRYGELVRDEIAHTVNDPREVEDELRHLLAVLSGAA